MKKTAADLLIVAGIGLITAGIWQLSPPAAFVFAGFCIASVGVLVHRA